METMPDTEEMADFSAVLKSFYEAVYEPHNQEPPHILRIFKKPVESPKKDNDNDLPKDIVHTNSQTYDEESKTFENDKIEISLENVSMPQDLHSNDQINGDYIDDDIQRYNFNHESNSTINGLTNSADNTKDVVSSLEDMGDHIENVNGSHLNASLEDDAHDTSMQPKPLYIVEVSNKKKGPPLNKEDSEDLINDNDHGELLFSCVVSKKLCVLIAREQSQHASMLS